MNEKGMVRADGSDARSPLQSLSAGASIRLLSDLVKRNFGRFRLFTERKKRKMGREEDGKFGALEDWGFDA